MVLVALKTSIFLKDLMSERPWFVVSGEICPEEVSVTQVMVVQKLKLISGLRITKELKSSPQERSDYSS